jgi:hypothetical protein
MVRNVELLNADGSHHCWITQGEAHDVEDHESTVRRAIPKRINCGSKIHLQRGVILAGPVLCCSSFEGRTEIVERFA